VGAIGVSPTANFSEDMNASPEQAEPLRELIHQDPRKFGKHSSLWSLEMAAEVSFEKGLTEERVAGETVRATLARLGVRRAPHAGSLHQIRSM
jgi:hypothetical protein